MKQISILFTIIFCFHFSGLSAQEKTDTGLQKKRSGWIEIMPYVRWDSYPTFISKINYLDTVSLSLKGASYGVNINFKQPVAKKYEILIGFGYYKNTYNKIKRWSTRWSGITGDSRNRVVYYPDPTLWVIFVTDKYWYHSLAINIGGQINFNLKNNLELNISAMLSNYFTFSQRYHLDKQYLPMTFTGDVNYKTKEFSYSGLSALFEAGLQKKFNIFSVSPKLLLPVYTIWKKDEIIEDETNTGNRSKWFRDIGAGISFNYSLSSKNK
jgi:hypothetical protein